eukprot:gene8327-biopygen4609
MAEGNRTLKTAAFCVQEPALCVQGPAFAYSCVRVQLRSAFGCALPTQPRVPAHEPRGDAQRRRVVRRGLQRGDGLAVRHPDRVQARRPVRLPGERDDRHPGRVAGGAVRPPSDAGGGGARRGDIA